MSELRDRVIRRAGNVLVAALVLVPLLLSAHQHRSDHGTAASPCAACVVTHHSPTVGVSAVPQGCPHVETAAVPILRIILAGRVHGSPKTGRAPPLADTSLV